MIEVIKQGYVDIHNMYRELDDRLSTGDLDYLSMATADDMNEFLSNLNNFRTQVAKGLQYLKTTNQLTPGFEYRANQIATMDDIVRTRLYNIWNNSREQ